ncbi:MAG: hypothetical protein LBI06_08185 [Treponema sp.]|jgi:hypothetical protein|nr:hypothetical protein [Treponema sp.]
MTEINRRLYGLASLVSLAMGMGIYLFFRNTNMLLFEWIPKLQFFKDVYIPTRQSVFTSMLFYNLPDALWFLSGILLLRFIWFYKFKEQDVYIICFYLIGAIFEISQLSKNVLGTFDPLDLFFIGITALIEGLLYKNFVLRSLEWKGKGYRTSLR